MTPRSRSLRLFLALWPDEAVRARLAGHAAAWSLPRGCLRYEPQDWHVTLHYIGPLAIERVTELADAIDLPVQACELLLDKPRRWPRGLAVLEASRVPAGLMDLHRHLAARLSGLGLPVEQRRYRPHVTLARRAEAALAPTDAAPVAWATCSFALVVSTGDRTRRYEVLREYGRQLRC